MRIITVGIPVFNAMPYLPESLESILRQDYRDFEILIINDGSTDDSRDYLHSIRDPRVRIIDQENRGLTSSLNRMLAEANTPWLARHDADDVAYPHRLARAIDFIGMYPGSGMLYSFAEYYPAATVGRFRTSKGSPSEIRDVVRSGYLPAIAHPTVVLNVERAKWAGGYRFNLFVEDIDLWWRMALCYDIRLIPEVLTGLRQNPQSLSFVNLKVQALNTLYIQYLLLSHLWGYKPLDYEEVRIPLLLLFNTKKLKFRDHIRAFNIELGSGNRIKALAEAVNAFFASPKSFTGRLWDECSPRRFVMHGEAPALFKKHEGVLWPNRERIHSASFESLPPVTSRRK